MKHTFIKPLLLRAARLSLFQQFIICIALGSVSTCVWYTLIRPIYSSMRHSQTSHQAHQAGTTRPLRLRELIDQRVALQQRIQRMTLSPDETTQLVSLCARCSQSAVTLNSCSLNNHTELPGYRTYEYALSCSGSLSSIARLIRDVEQQCGANCTYLTIKPDFDNRYLADLTLTTIALVE